MSLRLLVLVLISVLTAVFSSQINASLYDRQSLKYAHKSYSRNLQRQLYSEIAHHLNKSELKTLSKTKLEQPWQATTPPFYFASSPSQYLIVMPTMSVKFFDDMTVAHTWLNRFDCGSDAIMDYVAALDLNPSINGNVLASLAIPENAYEFDHQVNDIAQQMFISGITYVLLHELGHIHLNHQDYKQVTSSEASVQEVSADDFAMEIMRRMHLAPTGITMYFSAMSYMEPSNHRGYQSHPLTAKRLRNIADHLARWPEQYIEPGRRSKRSVSDIVTIADALNSIADDLDSEEFRERVRKRGKLIKPDVLKKACNKSFTAISGKRP